MGGGILPKIFMNKFFWTKRVSKSWFFWHTYFAIVGGRPHHLRWVSTSCVRQQPHDVRHVGWGHQGSRFEQGIVVLCNATGMIVNNWISTFYLFFNSLFRTKRTKASSGWSCSWRWWRSWRPKALSTLSRSRSCWWRRDGNFGFLKICFCCLLMWFMKFWFFFKRLIKGLFHVCALQSLRNQWAGHLHREFCGSF